jgi:TolB-like protein/Tfp pilus assembly protein PilF/predicted Ser/Thr protein kinase
MIGETISHYKILEELGRGGMGVVYKAEDTRLRRSVALKFLPPELAADTEARERFLAEARSASALQHQSICAIYEIGESGGRPFISMEYIEGQSLRERIAAGPLPLDEAVETAVQIAEGLQEAHEKGIVHRDIKAANILLSKKGKAKITDFGLAKAIDRTVLTKEGTTLGTASYMSPEQTRGTEVDRRSDIWSLGIVLYEMIAGRRPFVGDYEQAVLYSIMNEDPVPLTGVRSNVPIVLERIVDKCLAKDVSERYQHADELIVDLHRLQRDSGAAAAGAKPGAHGGRRYSKPFIVMSVLIGLMVVVAGYVAIDWFRRLRTGEQEGTPSMRWDNSVAVIPFRDLSPGHDQEYLCDGMTDAINDRLSRFNELRVIATTSMMRFRDTAEDIKDIGKELGVENVVEGTIQREGDRLRVRAQLISSETGFHLWSETYDEKIESIFDLQDKISGAIAQALKLEIAPADLDEFSTDEKKNLEAYEYYMKGMHFIKSKYVISFQQEDFEAGLEMFDRAIGADSSYALAYYGLIWAHEIHHWVTGDVRDVISMRGYSAKAVELGGGSARINALWGYYLYEYKAEYDEAFRALKRALDINPNIGEVNFLVGACMLYHGLYEKAIPYLAKSVELDPYYFWTPYKLGMCYMNTGEFEKAAAYFEKYFELAPVVLIFPSSFIALNIGMGRYERVEQLIRDTEEKHPDFGGLPYCKALLLAARGKKEEALSLYANSEIYALLGMNDEAIRALESEIRSTTRYPHVFYLPLVNNPFYRKLQGDPRFQAIIDDERQLYEATMATYSYL